MSTKEINETREKIQSLIETLRKIKYVKNPIVKKDDTIHELNRILLRLKDDEVRQDPTLIQNLSMQAEKIFRESLAQELYVIQNAEFNNYNANQVVVLQAALAAQLITEQQLRNAIAVRNQRIAQLEANLANEQARVQQLTGDLAQRNADIGVLNQQVQQLTADVQAKDAQIAAHQNQIRLIENQLRNIKLAREHFRQVAQQETLRANQAEQKVNQAEQNANQAEQNANQLAIANQGLANQLEQKTTEFDHLKDAFQYRENEYKALDQAYDLIVREVKQMEADLQVRIQELNAANQQNEQLQQSLNLKDGELQAKEQELKQLELELKQLEQQLAQITKAFTDSQEDKRRVHEEKFHLEKRIKFLEQERNRLLKDFTDMTQTADKLKDQVIDKEKELAKQKKFYQDKLFAEQDRYETLNQEYQKLRTSDQGNLQAMADQKETIDELTIAFKSQKALIAELETKLQSQKDELAKKHQLINELQTQAKQEQMSAQELQAKIEKLEKLNVKQAEELKQISKEKSELEAKVTGLEEEIKKNKARLLELEEINNQLDEMYSNNLKDYQSLLSEINALTNGQEYEFKNPVFGQLAQLLKKSTGNTLQERIQWFGQQIGLIGSLKKKVTDQKIMIDELQSNQGQKASLAEQEILAIQADLEAKQKEIAELQQKLAEKENELRDSNIRNINYSTKINEINSELIRLRNTTEQNKAQIKFLEEQLEESQSKELKLREVGMKYSEIQQELNETKARLANKQKMLEAHTKLRESATKRMQENKSLNNKITELEKQLEQKETDYQSKLDNLQKQLAELGKIVQDDKEIQRKHQLELQAQKQQFEAERKQATQKLNEEMQELMALLDEATIKAKQKNDELLKQQEFHIKRMQTLTNKNAELEKELNNKKTQEEQLLRKITSVISNISFDAMDLDTAIDSFIAEYQKLEKLSTEQKALLEKQARELKTQTELLSAKQSEEQSKVNATSEELTNLQAKIKEQENHIKVLEEENKNLNNTKTRLIQENSELQKANLEFEQLLKDYHKAFELQRNRISALEENNDKLENVRLGNIADIMIQVEQKLKIVKHYELKEAQFYQTTINELIHMLSNFEGKARSYLDAYELAHINELIEKLEKRKNISIDLKTGTDVKMSDLTKDELEEFKKTVLAIQNVYSSFNEIAGRVSNEMNLLGDKVEIRRAFEQFEEMERNFIISELNNLIAYVNQNESLIGNSDDLKQDLINILENKELALQGLKNNYMKIKAVIEQAIGNGIYNIKRELQQKETQIKKLTKVIEEQETEIKSLETKSQELLKRFEKFGSSAFEQVQLLRKKIAELSNFQLRTLNGENILGLNKILHELEMISEEAKKTSLESETSDLPSLEFAPKHNGVIGQGEPSAKKPIRGGHDPSQIQQVQQVTGLAAIFGAFGILRFLMYAIIVVVLIVMVWHLFSSWRQEQSCRPYLADIYGLENEYYNHYIYS